MYILHVTREAGTDYRYGIRKSLLPVIEALQKRGHKVEVFDQKMATAISVTKFEAWLEKLYLKQMNKRFGETGKLFWQILSERISIGLRAAKYAAQQKVSHVHCHDPLLGYVYLFFAGIYGATKLWGYTNHAFGRFVKLHLGIESNEHTLAFLQNWEDKAVKTAKFVVTPTQTGLNQMMIDMELENLPPTWHVIPHAVVVSGYDRILVRQKTGIKDGEKLIIAVGQLIPMKRFPLLIESISMMHYRATQDYNSWRRT